MTKKSNAFGALFLVLLLSGGLATSTTSSTSDDSSSDSSGGDPPPLSQCEDGIDNDGDGFTDSEDPDCDINSPMYNGNES